MLKNYVSAMGSWSGRVDSEDDYETFRWHQWVQELDLNDNPEPFEGTLGFAFIGFCSEQGVRRNKGREGAAVMKPHSDIIKGIWHMMPPLIWEL